MRRQNSLGFIVRGSHSTLDGGLLDLRKHENGGLEGYVDQPG